MNKKTRHKPRAFSLIEMSVVILIISIIASGALTIAKSSMKNANIKITKDRMDAVYQAMSNYMKINRRLPCPASLAYDNTNSNFGKSIGSPGSCSGGDNNGTSGVIVITNLAWGMVPTAELGLPNDMASDGFGTKFEYVVDQRFTRKTTSVADAEATPDPIGFEGTAGNQAPNTILPIIMDIREGSASGTSLTSWAIMAIISHGYDKLGGFNATGTSQNTSTGASSDELENIRTSSFNTLFVNNSNDQNYDDIVLYKRKLDVATDAGLQFMFCPGSESAYYVTPSRTLYWTSSYYDGSTPVLSTQKCGNPNAKISRMCDKYGIWATAIGCIS